MADEKKSRAALVRELERLRRDKAAREKLDALTAEALRLIKSELPTHDILREIVTLIARGTGLEAVGLRLQEGEDFPYFQTKGLTEEFVRLENSLCPKGGHGAPPRDKDGNLILECACGMVIQNRVDRNEPFVTEYGSLWVNSNTDLVAERPHLLDQIRGNCIGSGYESSALIPLRFGTTTYGLLQLEDKRPGMFTPEMISGVELIALHLALALSQTRELRESEEKFRTLANSIPQLCWMANADGWIFWYNQRWYEYTGTTPEQMEGWGWQSVHDPAVLPQVLETWKTSITTGEPFDMVLPLRGADGVFRPFLTRTMPVRDQNGRVLRWCGTNTDITEREATKEALRESEERYRVLFQKSQAIKLLIDPETGRIVDANPAACAFYGYSVEECRGLTIDRLNASPREEVMARMAAAEASPQNSFEFKHRLSSGELREVAVASSPVVLNGRKLLYSIVADITERKKMDEDLLRAKAEADKGNKAKSEFLANMSHEIRTPMNGVLGMTELALMEDIPPRAREYLAFVKQSGRALLEIINDILDLSKIESGNAVLVKEPFALRESVESVCIPLSVSANEKRLVFLHSVDSHVPDHLVGDQGRLRQVLTNLVGNAIKFTEKGAVRVSVEVDGQPAPADSVRLFFKVQDDGIGIPKDRLDEIFEAFSQVGLSSHVKYGGTGLGLSISKSLVEMMGGTIWAESEVGMGSTFCFTAEFGLGETDSARRSARLRAAQRVRPLKLLLAEDNAVSRMLAVSLLENRGHSVVAVENGHDALEALAKEPFDAVLMDVRMPTMSGEEATGKIRNGEVPGLDPHIPIIALTAHALKGDRERFIAAGMDDYIAKPLEIDALDKVLGNIPTPPLARRSGPG